MLFSTSIFVFGFLPIVLLVHHVLTRRLKNSWLLVASLAFYSFGEPAFVLAMFGSIALSYALGLLAERERSVGSAWVVPTAALLHIGFLVAFKYSDWLVWNLSTVLLASGLIDAPLPRIVDWFSIGGAAREILFTSEGNVRLPIGISFFTFQALSYVIDVRRGEVQAERNPLRVALYIALFPQLIAGPIVRYHDVAREMENRDPRREDLARGIERFVIGLAKKLLIADVLAGPANAIFALPGDERTAIVAWFGLLCYTLEIYFDFSGYSDMAIGIGRMLGFRFKENFLHPYCAQSITEFWRRWHVSLSTWFRDYLYIPLGGNRRGPVRTAINLGLVFLACGLWHGAAGSFVVWGIWHGAFLIFERIGLSTLLAAAPRILRHAYAILVVMGGWVFFRAESLPLAAEYFTDLAPTFANSPYRLEHFVDPWIATCFVAGIVGCTPWLPRTIEHVHALRREDRYVAWCSARVLGALLFAVLFALCAMDLAKGSFHPFIYFRF